MYWATSFCERENSSKRDWMYVERTWWADEDWRAGAAVLL
jgi:hypothetical protein